MVFRSMTSTGSVSTRTSALNDSTNQSPETPAAGAGGSGAPPRASSPSSHGGDTDLLTPSGAPASSIRLMRVQYSRHARWSPPHAATNASVTRSVGSRRPSDAACTVLVA